MTEGEIIQAPSGFLYLTPQIPQWATTKLQYIYNYWKDSFLIPFWFTIKAKSQIPIQKASEQQQN